MDLTTYYHLSTLQVYAHDMHTFKIINLKKRRIILFIYKFLTHIKLLQYISTPCFECKTINVNFHSIFLSFFFSYEFVGFTI